MLDSFGYQVNRLQVNCTHKNHTSYMKVCKLCPPKATKTICLKPNAH